MLAHDEIRITVGKAVIRLRPTLRAAMRLERRHKGFGAIVAGLQGGRLGIMADLIEECADRAPEDLLGLMRGFEGSRSRGIGAVLTGLAGPLLTLTFALAGIDHDAKPEVTAGDAAKITFAELHERLFKIATGWLGWTPETAWTATPAEILTAYAGKIEMLQAIHGKAADTPSTPAPATAKDLDHKFRDTFRGIGTKVVRREEAA